MLEFIKMHGLGNDYVYMNAINQAPAHTRCQALYQSSAVPLQEFWAWRKTAWAETMISTFWAATP